MMILFAVTGCKTETDNVELTGITVTPPAKLTYNVGEKLDTEGMAVTAIYSDESTKDVTAEATITGYDKEKAGEQTVEVSYTENEITQTAIFTVTVKEKTTEPGKEPGNEPPKVELTKIEITKDPAKTVYIVGEELDTKGMVVTATYSDNSTKDVTAEVTTSGFDSSTPEESQAITVTYDGKTTTFTVKIAFNWFETPKQLSAGTDGTYGTKGTYVYFGVWPQDVVPVADVAGLALDENATTTIERGSFKFVKGTDGNYYVKCAENAYEPSYKYNKDNSDVGQGGTTYRWFKVMPIKWRVADSAYKDASGSSNGKLLVAENILTANVPYYEDYDNNRTIDSKTVYPNNYMHSQIRAYLNGNTYTGYDTSTSLNDEKLQWNNKGFLQTAFTTEAAAKIETTKVDNSEDSTTNYDTQNGTIEKATDYACAPTDDKIFLLSEYEVTKYSKSTEAYYSYGKGNSRIRVTTDFAKANNAYQCTIDGYGDYWWLRSPSNSYSHNARYVLDDGDASNYNYVIDNYGVVPALCISF